MEWCFPGDPGIDRKRNGGVEAAVPKACRFRTDPLLASGRQFRQDRIESRLACFAL
jgi:hypothetical protein